MIPPPDPGPLGRVLLAARARDAARAELRSAIFAAAQVGVPTSQIANACDRSRRFVQLVLAGKRLRPGDRS